MPLTISNFVVQSSYTFQSTTSLSKFHFGLAERASSSIHEDLAVVNASKLGARHLEAYRLAFALTLSIFVSTYPDIFCICCRVQIAKYNGCGAAFSSNRNTTTVAIADIHSIGIATGSDRCTSNRYSSFSHDWRSRILVYGLRLDGRTRRSFVSKIRLFARQFLCNNDTRGIDLCLNCRSRRRRTT